MTPPPTDDPILATAMCGYAAHVTMIPVKEDGSKRPDLPEWKHFQTERPTPAQMRTWFPNGRRRTGIGVITGPAGLQCLECDEPEMVAELAERCQAAGIGDTFDRVRRGYEERSPNGWHWLFYCNDIAGNEKLASRPKTLEEQNHSNDRVKVMFETRGVGGYVIIAPSYGGVHETGEPYVLVQGALDTICTISPDERDALFAVARSLDRMPPKDDRHEHNDAARGAEHGQPRHLDHDGAARLLARQDAPLGDRPGDDYNDRATWAETLEPHGWPFVFERGGEQYWRRPGKDRGISATTNYQDSGLLYIFSTSVPDFEIGRGYSKFSAHAILNHAGDFQAAARELAAQGYGESPTPLGPASASRSLSHSEDVEDTSWELPAPLEDPPPAPLPVDALPRWGAEYIAQLSRSTQTPTDLAVSQYLAALSTALQKKVTVRVRSDYSEPVNTFHLAVARSGARKSAIVKAMTEPIIAYQRQLVEQQQGEVAEKGAQKRVAERRLQLCEAAAAKAEGAEREEEERKVQEAAHELREMEAPALPRLLTDDCSPEKLVMLFMEQGGMMSIHTAEGTFFEIAAGRYTNGAPNLETYLKAHAGEDLYVDRVGRSSEYVESPALTLGVSVQPDVLISAGERRQLRDRGLLFRFAYVYPASVLGHRDSNPPPVDPAVEGAYGRMLTRLLEVEAAVDGEGVARPHALRLSSDAQRAWIAFMAQIEPRMAETGDLGHIDGWASKLTGLAVRYAGLLHMAERIEDPTAWATPISGDTMARAVRLATALIPHALRVFSAMAIDPALHDARYLLRHITELSDETGAPAQRFRRRTLHQKCRGHFPKIDARFIAGLAVLVEHGYIRQALEESGRPGPSPEQFDVNPQTHTQDPQEPPHETIISCLEDLEYASGGSSAEIGADPEGDEAPDFTPPRCAQCGSEEEISYAPPLNVPLCAGCAAAGGPEPSGE